MFLIAEEKYMLLSASVLVLKVILFGKNTNDVIFPATSFPALIKVAYGFAAVKRLSIFSFIISSPVSMPFSIEDFIKNSQIKVGISFFDNSFDTLVAILAIDLIKFTFPLILLKIFSKEY